MDTSGYNQQGKLFTAANQAAKLVTLINTSTTTGFVLSNPWGSSKKLAIASLGFLWTTVPTATSIVWACLSVAPSSVAHASTTAIDVYGADGSGLATGRTSARAYSIDTTPNLPVYTKSLGYAPTTPATTGWASRTFAEGELILVPGSYLQISYLGEAPTGMADATWAELPI